MTVPGSGTAKDPIHAFASDRIDLTIIIVSWNVSGLLAECLHSIVADISGLAVEVIVVDNASSDGTVGRLQRDFGWVRVLANDRNLGFARANNQALALARGRLILFLNPDARLLSGALAAMVDFLEHHPDAGIAGPLLLNPDGSVQRVCAHLLPTLRSVLLCEALRLSTFPVVGDWFYKTYISEYDYSITQEVESISGACMLLRRDVLDQVGGFGDCFIHCGEDIDLCFRVMQAGWKIVFVSGARVVHAWGQSTRQAPVRTMVNAAISVQHYFRRCYGVRSGATYRAVIQWLQAPISLVIGLVKLLLALESAAAFKQRLQFAKSIVLWRPL